MPSPQQLRAFIPFVASLAAFLLVLAAYASHHSAQYDEAITMLLISGDPHPDWPLGVVPASTLQQVFDGRASFLEAARASVRDVHPPLYFLLATAWRSTVASSLEGLRWLSVLLVLAQAVLLHRLFSGLRFPALTVLLFTTSGFVVGLGTFARGYALAQLLILVALAATARPATRTTLLLAGGACAAAQATHYFAFFPVAGIVLCWLACCTRQRDPRLLIPPALAVLGGLLVAPYALRASGSRPDQFAGFSGWLSEAKAAGLAVLRCFHPGADSLGPWADAVALTATAVLLFLGGATAIRRTRPHQAPRVAAVAFFAHFVGVLLVVALSDKTLYQATAVRYMSLVLPPAVILIGFGAQALPRRIQAVVLVSLVALQASQLRPSLFLQLDETVRLVQSNQGPVVLAAGHGRGIPAAMALELDPSVPVCVLRPENPCEELLASAAPVVSISTQPTPTTALRQRFLERCPGCRSVVLQITRFPER